MWKADDEVDYFSSSQKRWLRALVVRVRSNGDIKLKVFGSSNSNESRDVTVDARDVKAKIRMPFDRRGMTLRQLRDIHREYIQTGMLRKKCAEFNKCNAAAIQKGTVHEKAENLYALEDYVVKRETKQQSCSLLDFIVEVF